MYNDGQWAERPRFNSRQEQEFLSLLHRPALLAIEWSASHSSRLTARETAAGTHCIGSYAGPRAGLNVSCPWRQSNPESSIVQPINRSLNRLSYTGSQSQNTALNNSEQSPERCESDGPKGSIQYPTSTASSVKSFVQRKKTVLKFIPWKTMQVLYSELREKSTQNNGNEMEG